MADQKISALTSATTPLAGTEVLPIVQSSTTKKVSVDNLTLGKLVSMDKLLVGTGDSSAGANLRKYTAVWNTSPNTYPVPAGNIFAMLGDAVAGQENWFGFTGGYGTSSGSVNILLQQNLNNVSQQAGSFIGSEATSATAADIIMGKMVAGASATTTNSTKTVQARLKSGGDFQLADGNFVPSTAAKGVNFTANTPAAGMTSQLLNWYEEGTWTPAVTASSGGATSGGTFAGRYTRIGRQVTVICALESVGKNTLSGDITITGLPFTSANNGIYPTGNIRYDGLSTSAGTTTLYAVIAPSSTSIAIQQFSKDGYIADLNASNLTATFNFYNVTITYFV